MLSVDSCARADRAAAGSKMHYDGGGNPYLRSEMLALIWEDVQLDPVGFIPYFACCLGCCGACAAAVTG